MTAQLVDEMVFIQQSLAKTASSTASQTHAVWRLLRRVGETLEHAGTAILEAKQEFIRHSDDLSRENECLRSLKQYCEQSLKLFGKTLLDMGRDINLHLSDPLEAFYYDLQISHKKMQEQCLDLIDEIEENLRRLKELEKTFEEKKQTLKSKCSVIQDEQSKYRGLVVSTNDCWPSIQYSCSRLIEEFDTINESRCEFTKKQIVEFQRIMNRLAHSQQTELKLRELEKKPYEQFQLQENLTSEVEQQFGRSQLLRPLKIFSSIKVKLQANGLETSKQEVIDALTETYLVNSVQETSPKCRALVLENMASSEYFICCMCSRLHTEKSLPSNKYNDLLTLVKYIFAESMQHPDNQAVLYGILYLSLRVVNQGVPMIKELSKYREYWENDIRWDAMLQHIHSHLSKEHSRKVNTQLKKTDTILRRIPDKHSTDRHVSKYQALREVNILLTHLELNSEFSIHLIAHEARKLGLSREQTETLLIYQEQARKNTLDNMYFNRKAQLAMKEDRYMKNSKAGWAYAIKKCLPFLSIDLPAQLHGLKLVCKSWNEYLWLPVLKRYLIYESNLNKLAGLRCRVYQALIPQAYSEKLYHKMRSEVPESFNLLEQIRMDVRRSLNQRPQLRPRLSDMLTVFSYYNDKIGYLQGMNYIGETILKLPQRPESAYCMLEYMLKRYFSTLFVGNLENLKLKVYQLTRLMERYLPALAKHFENEKVESQHFLVSWIVTLWGQMEGDIVWLLWDGFLIEGWKWWAKVCIWLLGVFQSELLEMNFEDILKFFSDLANNPFFQCRFNDFLIIHVASPLTIKAEIGAVYVTNRMLELLEGEYLNSQRKYKDILKNLI